MKENRTILIALGLISLVMIVTSFLYYAERRRQETVKKTSQQVLDVESNVLAASSSGDLEITLHFYRPSAILDNLDILTFDETTKLTGQDITLKVDPLPLDSSLASQNERELEVSISENRSIFRTDDIVLTARQIVHEVMKGPSTEELQIFAPEARLRQIFILEDGTAMVDLSRHAIHPLLGGVAVELAALYSITHSLKKTIEEISRVIFLVNGQEQPTLNGHVSIRKPFM